MGRRSPFAAEGILVCLDAGDDLNAVLNRVKVAAGQALQAKTDIGENGFMAYFMDTEGNKIGLHSMGLSGIHRACGITASYTIYGAAAALHIIGG